MKYNLSKPFKLLQLALPTWGLFHMQAIEWIYLLAAPLLFVIFSSAGFSDFIGLETVDRYKYFAGLMFLRVEY